MVVRRGQCAAQNRLRTQHVKEITRHRRNVHAKGLAAIPDRLRPRFDTDRPRNLLERSRLMSKALEVPCRERQRPHALAAFPPEHDNALLVEDWERSPQHGIGDAEDCHGQTDAAGENENDCGRRVRLADHSAVATPQVIASVVQPGRQSHRSDCEPSAPELVRIRKCALPGHSHPSARWSAHTCGGRKGTVELCGLVSRNVLPSVPVLLGPIESSSYCTGTSRTTQPGTGAMRPYVVPAPVAWLMARYM